MYIISYHFRRSASTHYRFKFKTESITQEKTLKRLLNITKVQEVDTKISQFSWGECTQTPSVGVVQLRAQHNFAVTGIITDVALQMSCESMKYMYNRFLTRC